MADQSVRQAAIYLKEHGVKVADLEGLPRPIMGLKGCIPQFLHTHGVLRHAGYAKVNGHSRRSWKAGANYDALIARMQERGMV
jgi:phage tail sheath protein FI